MPIYSGSQKIKTLYVGGQKIKEAWTMVGGVLTKVYSAIPPFTPSGMTKNGDASVSNSWAELTGWIADAGSTLSGNGLVVNSGKTSALISAEVSWRSPGSASRTITARLKINGTIVATGAATTGSGSGNLWVSTVSASADVLVGDVVTIEIISGNSTGNPTILAGANTYVRIT